MPDHRKTIGILQPVFLPWLGYFEQMAQADHFIFLDDVQYTRQDWRNRNRIKTASGPIWLTVPTKKHPHRSSIRDIKINQEHDWQRRHIKSIEQNYGRCPYFQPFFSELVEAYRRDLRILVDLDCRLIKLMCRYLEIDTPTSFSSDVPRPAPDVRAEADGGPRTQRLIDICKHHRADRFYEGARGRDYININTFRSAGVDVIFQDYQHPEYPQQFGEFLSHMSAIDLIMNTGPEAPKILRWEWVSEDVAFSRKTGDGPVEPLVRPFPRGES